MLGEALAMFEASERSDLLAEASRLPGEFLLRQSVPDAMQITVCFQQALTLARRQQAKSWELHTAMRLSRLWQQQGKRTAAYELLAPIYGWFTEGFDTGGPARGQGAVGGPRGLRGAAGCVRGQGGATPAATPMLGSSCL